MSEPTEEQFKQAESLIDFGFGLSAEGSIPTMNRLAALIARAESAEAERDRFKAALVRIVDGDYGADDYADTIASAALAAAEVRT